MSVRVEEAHERGLEVAGVRAHRAVELAWGAGEQELTVDQHQDSVGVPLGLGHVVG
jgi:hypothetical protein